MKLPDFFGRWNYGNNVFIELTMRQQIRGTIWPKIIRVLQAADIGHRNFYIPKFSFIDQPNTSKGLLEVRFKTAADKAMFLFYMSCEND